MKVSALENMQAHITLSICNESEFFKAKGIKTFRMIMLVQTSKTYVNLH